MGCLFRLLFLLILPAAVIGLPAAGVVMGLDQTPMVTGGGKLSLKDFSHAQRRLLRYDPRRMKPDRITTITASAAELNTVLKASLSGIEQVAGRVAINRFGLLAAVSVTLPLPENPLGRYVNIRMAAAPSNSGLRISRLAVGRIEVPPALVLPTLELLLDQLVGAGKGTPIIASIRSLKVAGTRVTVAFRPPPALVEDLKAAAIKTVSVSHPRTVRVYYRRLMELLDRRGRSRTSLAGFITPLFRLAKQRSETHDPVRENEAVVLALAIFFGDGRFEKFVGEVRTPEMKSRRRKIDHVRLNGRHNFVQHFTISAGLAITGGGGGANIIGELKEVQDSGKASGFSFTDLAADRVGIRFAEGAVSSERGARRFQDRLGAATSEAAFFPVFTDLPEGMSRAEFKRRYRDTDSAAYQRVIAEIDRRIDKTRLYP
jgi:hypothetical protein